MYSTQVQSSSTPGKMAEKQSQGLATLPHYFKFIEHLPQCENVAVGLDHETVGVLEEKLKVFQSSGSPAFG